MSAMKRPARIAALCLTIGGGAVALLLWAKLKLVADIPRTVHAVPDQEADKSALPEQEINSNAAVESDQSSPANEAKKPDLPNN